VGFLTSMGSKASSGSVWGEHKKRHTKKRKEKRVRHHRRK